MVANTADYKQVRALTRGLSLLRALNACPDGVASSAELALATGMHRTTVRRFLETLIDEGLVRRSASDDGYRLTIHVRELSVGFTDAEWVSAIARPAMADLLHAVSWPSDLTTPDAEAMIVRETTHRFSALSFHRNMVGRRLPLLLTASGRAYFAFQPKARQDSMLALLKAGPDVQQAAVAANPRMVRRMVERVRADGYATNDGEWSLEAKTGSLAMPVLLGRRVLACLNIVYLHKALTPEVAVQRFAGPLREAVTRISNALQADRSGIVAAAFDESV